MFKEKKFSSKKKKENAIQSHLKFWQKKNWQISLIALLVLFISILIYLIQELPSPKNLSSLEHYAVSTQIFDRNGQLLYEVYGDENRTPIEIESLPEYLLQATIAIEDKNFHRHHGLDLRGLLRATINNLTGGNTQGGSTITQQLVKNALLSKERTLNRKIKEAILSILAEIIYSKEEILEMYLNYIAYGGTAVGIEAAANLYFDKTASDLTLAESSLLAGLPKAPSTYSPFGAYPEKAKMRQKEVLRRMLEDGYINEEQINEVENETLTYALKKTDIKAPHFVFYVIDLLQKEYGEEVVKAGGLRVRTTLDLDLQEVAQASLSAEIEDLARLKVSNGAALITKPNTGEILSMIGSKNYFDMENDGQVNVTLALRQPGSSIKPLMYASAFQEKTLNPGSMILDIPTCFRVAGQKDYCPKNYTGGFAGPVTIRQALGNSFNIPAVKALSTIGVEKFIEQANKMGISNWIDPSQYGLSLTLGGGEVMMVEMATAFGVLANQGVKVPSTAILEVKNYKGEILDSVDLEARVEALSAMTENENIEGESNLERVMRRAPAYLSTHIMQDNNARLMAFGSNNQLLIKDKVVSAKTGTTNDLKDNWTVGFTPEFLTIVWVGNNDNSSMSYLASGVTGAAPIWNDIMSYILKDEQVVWLDRPSDVKMSHVCQTGMPVDRGLGNNRNDLQNINVSDLTLKMDAQQTYLTETDPAQTCQASGQELYWEESLPSYSGSFQKEFWIRSETGLPAGFGEEADDLVLELHQFYYDPVTTLYCADCRRATDEETGKVIYERNYVN
ncbi:MAG: PBP1A family penicillin-binding protein [Candidatus Pacebacteria bacterium]|nr:PBP1A family penicillin-binding protein [Candidatus Paceibacterota bacterium]